MNCSNNSKRVTKWIKCKVSLKISYKLSILIAIASAHT